MYAKIDICPLWDDVHSAVETVATYMTGFALGLVVLTKTPQKRIEQPPVRIIFCRNNLTFSL